MDAGLSENKNGVFSGNIAEEGYSLSLKLSVYLGL